MILHKKTLIFWLQPVLIFCMVLAAATTFMRFNVDPHHDGILFKPALDVAQGKTLFRDTFTQYGALTTWLQAGALRLFGEKLVVLKLLTAVFYALSGVALWLVWAEILSPGWATLSGVLWLMLSPYLLAVSFIWSSVYALFFQMLSTWFFLRYLKRGKLWELFWCGCGVSLVFWCRQPVGFIHAFALFLCLMVFASPLAPSSVERTRRPIAYWMGGIFSVSTLFILWIISHGAFPDWWTQSIRFPFVFGEAFGGGFSLHRLCTVFFPYPQNPHNAGYLWDLFPAVSLLLFVFLVMVAIRKKHFTVEQASVLTLVVVSLGSWHQFYPFPCFMHSFWAASSMVGLLTYAVVSFFSRLPRPLRFFSAIACLAALYAKDFQARIPAIENYWRTPRVQMDTPTVLQGMYIDPEQAAMFTQLNRAFTEFFQEHPQAHLINATTDALFMTFSDRMDNFHPVYVKWSMIQHVLYPDYQARMLEYVHKNSPLIIAYIAPDLMKEQLAHPQTSVFNGEERFENYEIVTTTKTGLAVLRPRAHFTPEKTRK